MQEIFVITYQSRAQYMKAIAEIIDDFAGDVELCEGADVAVMAEVGKESLNVRISDALKLKDKGRIDQSIILITEANKRQLDAIIAVQREIDRLLDRTASDAILSKFRQFYPFEFGIDGGDDVLGLLEAIEGPGRTDLEAERVKIHELESRCVDENERLQFFRSRFADGSEDDEIVAMERSLSEWSAEISAAKGSILTTLLTETHRWIKQCSEHHNALHTTLKLAVPLLVLLLSPTATRDSKEVKTDI